MEMPKKSRQKSRLAITFSTCLTLVLIGLACHKSPPPSPNAIPSSIAAIAARGAIRLARNGVADESLITPSDIVKMR